MASEAADRADQLPAVWATLVGGNVSPTALANLAAELRLTERSVVDLCARLNIGLGPVAKSERHQRAAAARWNRSPANF